MQPKRKYEKWYTELGHTAKYGDFVQVIWADHFRFTGQMPNRQFLVYTYGRLDDMNEDGIAVIQNEVPEPGDYTIRNMDSQFILKEVIYDIEHIK